MSAGAFAARLEQRTADKENADGLDPADGLEDRNGRDEAPVPEQPGWQAEEQRETDNRKGEQCNDANNFCNILNHISSNM